MDLFEAWLMYLWWLLVLSASLESAEKEEIATQHGEELLSIIMGDETCMPQNWCNSNPYVLFSFCRWANWTAENRYSALVRSRTGWLWNWCLICFTHYLTWLQECFLFLFHFLYVSPFSCLALVLHCFITLSPQIRWSMRPLKRTRRLRWTVSLT